MKAFVIDVSICNGCYNCQIACKDEHCSNDWMPIAAPQPETGQFWCKLNEYIRGSVPKVKMHYIPVLCQHCDDAPCMKAFPEVIYKREDGMVVIDPEKAKGIKGIEASCPWGVIYLQRRTRSRSEVHRLCPPSRSRLERTTMRRCLSDRRHQVRRRRRPERRPRKAPFFSNPNWAAPPASTTRTSPRPSSAAPSTIRARTRS